MSCASAQLLPALCADLLCRAVIKEQNYSLEIPCFTAKGISQITAGPSPPLASVSTTLLSSWMPARGLPWVVLSRSIPGVGHFPGKHLTLGGVLDWTALKEDE